MRSSIAMLLVGVFLSGTAAATPAAAPASTTPAASPIPDTYAGIVAEMRTQAAAIETGLNGEKVSAAREPAKRLGELAGGVAGKAGSLPAEARSNVTAAATRIQEKVAEILAASDKNDMPTAKTAFNKIKTDIDILASYAK